MMRSLLTILLSICLCVCLCASVSAQPLPTTYTAGNVIHSSWANSVGTLVNSLNTTVSGFSAGTFGTISSAIWNGTNITCAYLGNGTASAGEYLDGAGNWTVLPSSTNATSLTQGLVSASVGGTGANTSSSTGIAQVSSGTWSVAALTNAQMPSAALNPSLSNITAGTLAIELQMGAHNITTTGNITVTSCVVNGNLTASGTVNATALQVNGAAVGGSISLSNITAGTLAAAKYQVASKTANYTVLSTDFVLSCSNATTPFNITLPAATGSGQVLKIYNVGAAAVTIQRAGSDLIMGQTSFALVQYTSVEVIDLASTVWGR